jgi:carbamoylphosphate synthase large subunit
MYSVNEKLNILLSSVGRRSYLVEYFQRALGQSGKVHVSNSDKHTPVFNITSNSVVTPKIYDESYIPFLLKYCMENHINAIVPLFDVDLPILSKNVKLFSDLEIRIIVSKRSVINICNDKWQTYKFLLKNNLSTPKTFVSLNEAKDNLDNGIINFPVIIKPRWGMGSISVFVACNKEELYVLYNKVKQDIKTSYLKYESSKNFEDAVLIQEKLGGDEYGLDVINNLDGVYMNTIVKRKLAMRAGETDSAIVVDNVILKNLGRQLSNHLGHISNLDVDVFLENGIAYVLEMNARFGGGYPFSHLAGVNLPLAIVEWLRDIKVNEDILQETIGVKGHKNINIVEIL